MNTLKKFDLKRIFYWLGWGLLFTLAYSQAPLFTSNQNQYFLKGLAKAGWGYLENDWLVNTKDPVPVFSFLVEWTYRIFQTELVFYLVYAIALGVYFYYMTGIVSHLAKIDAGWKRGLLAFSLLGLHSAALRQLLNETLGFDWKYVLEGGVAGQRILGEVFQPSSAGILLIISIFFFLKGKRDFAVVLLPIAATIHPTYLLSAAMLTGSYMLIAWLEQKKWEQPLKFGAIALVMVLPTLLYSLTVFTATSPEVYARTREKLVNFRIPHHAIVAEWFNASVLVGLGIVLLAIFLLRKNKFVWLLVIPLATALLLTLLQLISGSYSLALIFPWRLSAFLIPLSSSLVLGFGIRHFIAWRGTCLDSNWKPLLVILSTLTIVLVAFGIFRFKEMEAEKQDAPEASVMAWAEANAAPDQLYMIPIKMQEFRLETGIPAFVEFKSIPYQDVEVAEWLGRVYDTSDFYREAQNPGVDNCAVLAEFEVFQITYLILPAELEFIQCEFLTELYRDSNYIVRKFEFNP